MTFSSETATFSTRSMRPNDSVRAWRRHLAEVYFRLDVTPYDRDYIDGHLRKRSLGNIKVSELRGNRQRMVRTAELAKLDHVDSYVFIAPITGDFAYRHRKVNDIASHGQLFALPSGEFHEVCISDNARMLCFEVPHHILENRMARIDDFCAAGTFSDPLTVSLLRDAADRILRLDTGLDTGRIEDICLNLIEAAVSSERTIVEKDGHLLNAAMHARLSQVIRLNLRDCGFGLAQAAAACGTDPRHLQRVLRARNTTFAREIASARLTEAEKLIRLPGGQPTAINRVAAQCGFSSPGYFATCYRRRFGRSPRDDMKS